MTLKRGTINIVITFSLICVLGVLFFQAIWVKHALMVSEEHFDRAVVDAMNDAVAVLEKRIVYNNYRSEFVGDSNNKAEVHIVMQNSDKHLVEILQVDSVVRVNSHNDTLRHVVRDERSTVLFGDSLVSDMKNRVSNIVGHILEDIKTDTALLRLPVGIMGLDSVLLELFDQKGVTTRFEYAIRGGEGILADKSEGFDEKHPDDSYKVLMYPLHIASRPDELLVQVPSRSKSHQVLMSVLPVLGASVVFTVFIIITFWLTIRTILKQKKISTIKNDFINNMTHEFKTPIATIRLAADALKNLGAGEAQVDYFASVIKQESTNMNQKVETILQMALLEQQQVTLNMKEADANAIINQTLKHMALQLEASAATVETDLQAVKTTVLADTMHLTNVLANIIDNAIKYAGGTPHILIATANEGASIVLKIKDNGIGMTKEDQKRVFEKFFRVQSGNIHNTKGFGLGLSYACEIVKLHKGSIEIESEKHKGTTVILRLPTVND